MERQHENADFADKIIFNKEAHFSFKCRIWDEENPRAIHEKQVHLVTVWCGFWNREIIGSFYENEAITRFFFFLELKK